MAKEKPNHAFTKDFWIRIDCSPERSDYLFGRFFDLLKEGLDENCDSTWFINRLAEETDITVAEKLGMAYKFGETLQKLCGGPKLD